MQAHDTVSSIKQMEALKEISITHEREDCKFPIKAVGNPRIKPETLLYNINKIVNPNDISTIDYTKGGTNDHVLEPLNSLFSDNIVFGCYIKQESVHTMAKVIKDLLEKAKTEDVEEEDDDTANGKLIEIAKPYLAENTEKIKRILLTGNMDVTKRDIKPTGVKEYDGKLTKLIKGIFGRMRRGKSSYIS
jgi:hypothetical protein